MSSLRLIGTPGAAGAEQQLAVAAQLLDVLQAEFTALQNSDAQALSTAANDKARLLRSLDPMVRATMAAPQRERLDELLIEAREHNQRNGEFIAAQQAYVRARWAGLSAIAGQSGLYGADGITRLPGQPRGTFGHA